MALTQQKQPVEGVLGSTPGMPTRKQINDIWGLRGVLAGPWKSFWGPGGKAESGEGSGGPRKVPGRPWMGPLETFAFS